VKGTLTVPNHLDGHDHRHAVPADPAAPRRSMSGRDRTAAQQLLILTTAAAQQGPGTARQRRRDSVERRSYQAERCELVEELVRDGLLEVLSVFAHAPV